MSKEWCILRRIRFWMTKLSTWLTYFKVVYFNSVRYKLYLVSMTGFFFKIRFLLIIFIFFRTKYIEVNMFYCTTIFWKKNTKIRAICKLKFEKFNRVSSLVHWASINTNTIFCHYIPMQLFCSTFFYTSRFQVILKRPFQRDLCRF